MMLDEKRRMIAQRFGLDIVVDKLPIALSGINVRAAMARRRAAEQTKAHERVSRVAAPM